MPWATHVKPLVAGSAATSTWGSSAGHDRGIEPTRVTPSSRPTIVGTCWPSPFDPCGPSSDVELEIVVVDDGSSDGTSGGCRQLDEPRLRVLRQEEPRGVAAARNAGVELATLPTSRSATTTTSGRRTSSPPNSPRSSEDPGRQLELHVFDVVRRGRAGRGRAGALPGGAADPGRAHRGCLSTERRPRRRLVGPGRDRSRAGCGRLPRRGWPKTGTLDPPRALGAGRAGFEAAFRVPRLANSQQLSLVRPAPDAGRDFDAVSDRYAAEAEALGVEQDDVADDMHLAKIALRCGLRHESFVRYSHLARKDPKKIVWAFAALVSPSVVDQATDRRSARTVPRVVRAEVLQWMMPLLSDPAFS